MNIPEEITTLGGAVRWARKRLGLSQEQLGSRLGYSNGQGLISALELGAGTKLHHELSVALEVPLAELIGRPKGPAVDNRLTADQAAARPTVEPRRCGMCRQRGHLTAECHLRTRRRNHFCRECCGLSHRRVKGERCLCGDWYAPEVVTRPEPVAQSSAQLCVDAA